MTKITILSILAALLLSLSGQTDFITEQKQYARVRTAQKEKHVYLENILRENQKYVFRKS